MTCSKHTLGPQLRRAQGNSQENSPHPPTLRMVEREKKHCIKNNFQKNTFNVALLQMSYRIGRSCMVLKQKQKQKQKDCTAPFKDIL